MKKLRKILIFVLCAVAVLCTVGFSNVKVDAKIVNFKVHQTSSTDATIDTPMKGVSVTFKNTYTTKDQLTKNNSMTLTIKGYPYIVKDIILNCHTNASKGAGTIDITRGTDILVKKDFVTALGGNTDKYKLVTLNATQTTNVTDDIVIKISASKNSLYCNSFTIVSDVVINEYDVTFDSGITGSQIETVKVEEGNKVSKPLDPMQEGKTFLGWYNGETLFDFNTPITSNITLVAKWKSQEVFDNFILSSTHSSLNVNYTSSGNKTKSVLTISSTTINDVNSFNFENINYKFAQASGSTKPSKYSDHIRLYARGELTITAPEVIDTITINYKRDKDAKDNKNEILSNATTTIVESDTTTIATIKCTNTNVANIEIGGTSGHAKIYSIEINYGNENYTISNVDLRFGTMVPVADYDAMVAEGAKFGVTLQKGTNAEQTFECAPVRVNEKGVEDAQGNFYQFAVVLTNVPSTDYAVSVTGKCYVEINGVKHYMVEKTTSVKATAQDYLNLTDKTAIEAHLGALTELAK